MNEKMIKNYRRFQKYTKKIGVVTLVLSVICLLLFPNHLYIGAILFVASVSAFGQWAYLTITLYTYDHHHKQ